MNVLWKWCLVERPMQSAAGDRIINLLVVCKHHAINIFEQLQMSSQVSLCVVVVFFVVDVFGDGGAASFGFFS